MGEFVIDQMTKLATIHWIKFGERIPIIPGFFDLVHFRNTGAAFGMFSESSSGFRDPFFYAIAVVITIFLVLYLRTMLDRERAVPLAISLVFAGIAGNVLDRIRLGSVVDFLSFHIGSRALDFSLFGKSYHIPLEWPAFNVADSAITVAMTMLVISAFKRKD